MLQRRPHKQLTPIKHADNVKVGAMPSLHKTQTLHTQAMSDSPVTPSDPAHEDNW